MHPSHPLEIRGYSVTRSLVTVTVFMMPVVLFVLWWTGSATNGDRRLAVLAGLVAAVPAVAAVSFKVRLDFDPVGGVLTVTRRWWYGAARQWTVPGDRLTAWYYVGFSQQLVLHRAGEAPLRFTLFMNGGPERLVAWAGYYLGGPDPEAAERDAKRARLTVGLSLGLGVPAAAAAIVAVALLVVG
ncbi:hypothetical protein [Glycomyces salinus]|uniref:hypothetical protein n=1 Tax=Glycomyces salinus TaxID=980294 RepID=UPI0018EAAADC|nr:hypothetical protein [Glycomyces salinus]